MSPTADGNSFSPLSALVDKPDTRWEFVRLPSAHESWIWRCVRADGTAFSAAEAKESFGKIMVDAVLKGFSSGTQHWTVKDRDWTTDFAPGQIPKTTRGDPTTIPPSGPKPSDDSR